MGWMYHQFEIPFIQRLSQISSRTKFLRLPTILLIHSLSTFPVVSISPQSMPALTQVLTCTVPTFGASTSRRDEPESPSVSTSQPTKTSVDRPTKVKSDISGLGNSFMKKLTNTFLRSSRDRREYQSSLRLVYFSSHKTDRELQKLM